MFSIPNILTAARITGAAVLLFLKPTSALFLAIYTVCGITDVLDGTLARLMKKTSDFGAKFDSIADLIFYFVLFFCLWKTLIACLPAAVWVMLCFVLALRLASYLVAFFKFHRFSSMHTYLNKLTGFAVFILPYAVKIGITVQYGVFACSVGMLASLEEMLIHLRNSSYNPTVKSLLFSKKQKEKNYAEN